MDIRRILWNGLGRASRCASRRRAHVALAGRRDGHACAAGDAAAPAGRHHTTATAPDRGRTRKTRGASGRFGVRQDDAARAAHAAGGSTADLLRLRAGDLASAPDAVLYPRNEFDVLAVLRLCAEQNIAVVPFGGGTGTGVVPSRGTHAIGRDPEHIQPAARHIRRHHVGTGRRRRRRHPAWSWSVSSTNVT